MKKYILTLAVATIGLLQTGCREEELELGPYNSITLDQVFNTQTDFQNAVNGMYAGFLGASYYGGDFIIVPDLLADNLIINQRGRLTNRTFSEWIYSGESTSGLFFSAYGVIRRANAVLENIDKLPAGAPRDNFRGEALAVRALAHFDLLRMYAKAYTTASAADLGVPYVTSTDPTLKPSREPVKTGYDKVRDDLIEAEKLIATANGVGRLSRAGVNGLLARLYLYRAEWQAAVDAATKTLTASPGIGTIQEFPSIFRDATENGVLFKIRVVDKDAISVGVNYSQASANGIRSEYVIDYDLFTKYAANDVRKTAGISTSAFSGTPYNHIAKYLGRPVGNANVVDPKVLRTAEVLITRAEALAQLGKDPEALADLNRLRQNRYTAFDATKAIETGPDLKLVIDLERRLELAFEGHRFFDLKRKNLSVVRVVKYGDRADGTGVTYVKGTIPAGDPRFQLPIPQAEINANPNVVQNPGY
ncbi:MAG: RagB/SusD family nutrient uptake outer membrane protein [Cytophagaceae bacterium]|nr:RagB/SusD family nutrient uptake outer membrane protein [Cytophagaceae bacterium]